MEAESTNGGQTREGKGRAGVQKRRPGRLLVLCLLRLNRSIIARRDRLMVTTPYAKERALDYNTTPRPTRCCVEKPVPSCVASTAPVPLRLIWPPPERPWPPPRE